MLRLSLVLLWPLILIGCDEQPPTDDVGTPPNGKRPEQPPVKPKGPVSPSPGPSPSDNGAPVEVAFAPHDAADVAQLLAIWRALPAESVTTTQKLQFVERWCELDLDSLDEALQELEDPVVQTNFIPKMKRFHLENPEKFIDLAQEIEFKHGREASIESVVSSVLKESPQQAADLVIEKLGLGRLRHNNLRLIYRVALAGDVESVRTALASYKDLQFKEDRSSFQVALDSLAERKEQGELILATAEEMGIAEPVLAAFEKRLAKLAHENQ